MSIVLAGVVAKFVLPIIASGVVALTSWAAAKFFHVKIDSSKQAQVMTKLGLLTVSVVQEIEQVNKSDAKRDSDGKLGPDTAKEFRDLAIRKLQAYLGDGGIDEIVDVLGVPRSAVVDFLITQIESTIRIVKPGAANGTAKAA